MAFAAVAIGCAANIKLSGALLAVPVLLHCLFHQRWLRSSLALILAPAIYLALFMLGLRLSHEPHGVVDALRATKVIVVHHAGLTSFTHPLTSRWYTWFLPTRPVTLRYDVVYPNLVRAMTSLGNPLLWWTSDLVLLGGLGLSARAVFRFARERRKTVKIGRLARANASIMAFALALLLPWVIGNRDSYIYHYLPTYAFLLLLVAGDLSVVYRRHRIGAVAFVAAVGLVSVYYAPVWAQLPINPSGFKARLFLKTWR
jgi:dolichyl-phosphate-mannose--protein O-mannosyl transferase